MSSVPEVRVLDSLLVEYLDDVWRCCFAQPQRSSGGTGIASGASRRLKRRGHPDGQPEPSPPYTATGTQAGVPSMPTKRARVWSRLLSLPHSTVAYGNLLNHCPPVHLLSREQRQLQRQWQLQRQQLKGTIVRADGRDTSPAMGLKRQGGTPLPYCDQLNDEQCAMEELITRVFEPLPGELLENKRTRRHCYRVCALLLVHQPSLHAAPFLPFICLAVARAVPSDPIVSFELALHLLVNVCHSWVDAFPLGPERLLGALARFALGVRPVPGPRVRDSGLWGRRGPRLTSEEAHRLLREKLYTVAQHLCSIDDSSRPDGHGAPSESTVLLNCFLLPLETVFLYSFSSIAATSSAASAAAPEDVTHAPPLPKQRASSVSRAASAAARPPAQTANPLGSTTPQLPLSPSSWITMMDAVLRRADGVCFYCAISLGLLVYYSEALLRCHTPVEAYAVICSPVPTVEAEQRVLAMAHMFSKTLAVPVRPQIQLQPRFTESRSDAFYYTLIPIGCSSALEKEAAARRQGAYASFDTGPAAAAVDHSGSQLFGGHVFERVECPLVADKSAFGSDRVGYELYTASYQLQADPVTHFSRPTEAEHDPAGGISSSCGREKCDSDQHRYRGSLDLISFALDHQEPTIHTCEVPAGRLVSSYPVTAPSRGGLNPKFPGVFDIVWLDSEHLLASCTDGCVRVIPRRCLTPGGDSVCPGADVSSFRIGTQMVTSCCRYDWYPVRSRPYASDSKNPNCSLDSPLHGSQSRFLATFHGGTVCSFTWEDATAIRGANAMPSTAVVTTWRGHEFDAWCCASGSTFLSATAAICSGTPLATTGGGMAFTGGDDGCMRLWDLRCDVGQATRTVQVGGPDVDPFPAGDDPELVPRSAAATMRFDAGVVSICALGGVVGLTGNGVVANAALCGAAVTGGATDDDDSLVPDPCCYGYSSPYFEAADSPYVLVGSYDEHLHLVDVRSFRRPVESLHVGGGVWRSTRPVFRVSSTRRHLPFTPHRNVLALPLMQRGAALVAYRVPSPQIEATPAGMQQPTDVFELLAYTHYDPTEGEGALEVPSGSAQTEQTLVYDCAVLQVHKSCCRSQRDGSHAGSDSIHGYTADVATCSFYEKRVDVFSIEL